MKDLIHGVTYWPEEGEIFEKVSAVETELQIQHGLTAEGFRLLSNQINHLGHKERRKVRHRGMSTMPNGKSVILTTYDDETKTADDFMLNTQGFPDVWRIDIRERGDLHLFGIRFGASERWIVGNCDRLNGKYLYEVFVKQGIAFSCRLTISQIGQALFEGFAPQIEATDKKWTISWLGGWVNKRYFTYDNFPFRHVAEFRNAPVMLKKLHTGLISQENVKRYSESLRQFSDVAERIVIATYPFVAIMASQLEESGVDSRFVINMVPCNRYSVGMICNLLQICNRERLLPTSLDVSTKELNIILTEKKDEVLILDAKEVAVETEYQKKKKAVNMARAISAFLGTSEMLEMISPIGLVTISSAFCPGEKVLNILMDKEMVEMTEDALGAIFSKFIQYVEKHQEVVRTTIDRKHDAFAIVGNLLKDFWAMLGYEFEEIAGINMADISYEKLLGERIFDVEEVVAVFVDAMRKDASYYVFERKVHGELSVGDVIFNDIWLWIPTRIFLEVCERNGLKKHMKLLLLKCKEKQFLRTDAVGFSRKLTMGNNTQEYYQFSRNVFNSPGMLDIVEIGKGGR